MKTRLVVLFTFISLIIIMIPSCIIEKKRYSQGYYFESLKKQRLKQPEYLQNSDLIINDTLLHPQENTQSSETYPLYTKLTTQRDSAACRQAYPETIDDPTFFNSPTMYSDRVFTESHASDKQEDKETQIPNTGSNDLTSWEKKAIWFSIIHFTFISALIALSILVFTISAVRIPMLLVFSANLLFCGLARPHRKHEDEMTSKKGIRLFLRFFFILNIVVLYLALGYFLISTI